MIPELFLLDDGWIDLDLVNPRSPASDDPNTGRHSGEEPATVFGEKVRGRMERQEIKPPRPSSVGWTIPLLFELGRLISDIATADVRQFLRDPKGWK